MQALPKAIPFGSCRLLCTAAALSWALAGLTGAAGAQERVRPGEAMAQAVVQPLPNQDNLNLNAALSRLGKNPRDLAALVDAGNAALAMGDVEAATGFFRRADQVAPKDPRVKAGLGGVLVRRGNPLEALPLFEDAARAGAPMAALAGDRGLAYDLVGDNATAQALYRIALQRGPDEEVTRRLALSLAISGDRRGTEATLLPLLRQQDKAAWRSRTFALAILGQTDEAIRTAKTILPSDLADSMAPYLRYMPQLTKAQQAAAANLGNFPRASEIGRDDPRFAQYVASSARSTALAVASSGRPASGNASRSRAEAAPPPATAPARVASRASSGSASRNARVAPPEPQPGRELAAVASAPPRQPQSMSAPVTASAKPTIPQISAIASPPKSRPRAADVAFAPELPSTAPAQAAPARPPAAVQTPPRAPAPAPSRAAPAPGFDLARLPQSQAAPASPPPAASPPAAPAPVAAPTAPAPAAPPAVAALPATPAPAPRVSLADAFSDLGTPSTAAAASAGAVDIRRIAPTRPKADPAKAVPPKPAPPSHPSRIWVQLGVGRDKGAMATDWKRLTKQAAAVFKGRKPYVSIMGQTNRMLAGPFDSTAQANKFLADLRGAGINGSYVWTSPAGQVVDALPVR